MVLIFFIHQSGRYGTPSPRGVGLRQPLKFHQSFSQLSAEPQRFPCFLSSFPFFLFLFFFLVCCRPAVVIAFLPACCGASCCLVLAFPLSLSYRLSYGCMRTLRGCCGGCLYPFIVLSVRGSIRWLFADTPTACSSSAPPLLCVLRRSV